MENGVGERYTSVEATVWALGVETAKFQILFSSSQIDEPRTVVSLSHIVTFYSNNRVFDNRIRPLRLGTT